MLLRDKYQAVLAVFDQLDVGLCVTLENAKVVARNTETDRILRSQGGLQLNAKNRLRCVDHNCNTRLYEALRAACGESRDQSTDQELILLPCTTDPTRNILIEVTSLEYYGSAGDMGYDCALIKLINPMRLRTFSVKRAVHVFGFTEAEARICQLLINGKTAQSIAKSRRVSRETIKSQISSIKRKTKSKHRTDLIRLVASIASPL